MNAISPTMITLMRAVPSESIAWAFLEQIRWGSGGPRCPRCGSVDQSWFMASRQYVAPRGRRVWKCKRCRTEFTAASGTLIARGKVPVSEWLKLIADHAEGKPLVDLRAKYGVSAQGARRIADMLERGVFDGAW